MHSAEGWPDLPDPDAAKIEFQKSVFQARVQAWAAEHQPPSRADLEKLELAADIDREKAAKAADYALLQEYFKAHLDVAKAAVERAGNRAELVQKAAAAIGTAYTGVLALSFSAAGTRLPPRAVLPAVFLGAALVLAAVYGAYLNRSRSTLAPKGAPDLEGLAINRLAAFLNWTAALTLNRVWFLHAAVVSLGLGVVLLPAAYLDAPSGAFVSAAAVGALLVLVIPTVVDRTARR